MSQTKKVLNVYTKAAVPIRSVHFTYDRPEHHALYEQIFACPVYFNASNNVLRIDASFLDARPVFPCEEVRSLCEAHCERLLTKVRSTLNVSDAIRSQLVSEPGRRPTLSRISTHMAMNSRRLRRKLGEERKNFQSVLNDVRKEMAIDYLETTTLSPKQIAFNLGYSNVHNFRRAFHAWTGTTPTRYRERRAASPARRYNASKSMLPFMSGDACDAANRVQGFEGSAVSGTIRARRADVAVLE